MLEAQHLAEAHASRRIDTRVVVDVADQIVVASYERAYYAEVRLEACAERNRVFLAYEVGELALKLKVKVKRTVEEARTGAARSILLNRLDGSLHDFRTRRETKVVVRAEHDAALAFHDDNGILPGFKPVEIRIDSRLARFLRTPVGKHFIKQVLHIILPSRFNFVYSTTAFYAITCSLK